MTAARTMYSYPTYCPCCTAPIKAPLLYSVPDEHYCAHCRICESAWWIVWCEGCNGVYEFPYNAQGADCRVVCECGHVYECPAHPPITRVTVAAERGLVSKFLRMFW